MDNVTWKEATGTDGQICRFIDLNKERPGNWQFIDVDKFEAQVREDEVRKWVMKSRRERAREKARKKARREVMFADVVMKIIGGLIIFLGYSASMWTHEIGPIFAMGFVGAVLIFAVSSVKDKAVDSLYREYTEEYLDIDERNDVNV